MLIVFLGNKKRLGFNSLVEKIKKSLLARNKIIELAMEWQNPEINKEK
jgi:hypothetical protein